jgi:iron complex outermembrane receptor protein
MKTFSVFIAFLLITVSAGAQFNLRGRITDLQTGEGLPGATVKAGTSLVTTAETGTFEINVPESTHAISVSYIGYQSREIPVSAGNDFLIIALVNTDINLSTVTVTGYESNRRLFETAGAIGLLRSKELQRGDNMDIMSAINTIPGVKMEAYSAGNYRISIRGSLVNNPWGIRNVRIYWNDIPLSSPDGTAQKSIDFDPAIIGSVEVLKGPSGSMYGAGNGGVLLIKNVKAEVGQSYFETGFTAGSYGFSRFNASYKTSAENFNIAANIIRQRYNGYRENNWGDKDVINVFAQYTPGEKRSLHFFATHVTGSLGIAGGINKSQADSMPEQALRYNKNNKISVKKYDATALGASQTYKFNENFSNTTSVYGNFQTYDHPFGSSIFYNGYLKESLSGYGARTKFLFTPHIDHIKSRLSLGAEYQYQHQFGNTFTIVNDQPGTWPEAGDLYQNDIIRSKANMVFAQAEFDLPWRFFLTAGASYTRLSYDVLDLLKAPNHVDYSGLLQFPEKISPRIGVVKLIDKNWAVHASMSYGYSPPPVWEINNYDGTLNSGIRPEDGRNYEVGIRGNVFKSRLNFDVSVYQMFLKNAIVPVASPAGTTAYRNAGATNQKGLEAMIKWHVVDAPSAALTSLKPWISYTFNHYRFTDYKTQSFDFGSSTVVTVDNSGKKVTGVVPHSLTAGIDLGMRCGLYLNASYYYYDKIPLNDANTFYADSYALLNGKIGLKKDILRMGINVFAGINNAFDTRYTSLLLYNADATSFGNPPQFYNPSAGVNYFAGCSLKYNFK